MQETSTTSTIRPQFIRFLILGAVKTIVTGLLFYALAVILPTTVAFTLVYFLSLLVVALLTPRFVFRVQARHGKVALLLSWYLVVYIVGVGVVNGLDALSDSRLVLTVGTICVTAPLGFAGARLLLWRPVESFVLFTGC